MLVERIALAVLLPCLTGLALVGALAVLARRWRGLSGAQPARRVATLPAAAGVIATPFIAVHRWMEHASMARVPTPLVARGIDYAMERSWGIGGPGDNKTGFVVFDVTGDGIAQVSREGNAAIGTASPERRRPTPIVIAADNRVARLHGVIVGRYAPVGEELP